MKIETNEAYDRYIKELNEVAANLKSVTTTNSHVPLNACPGCGRCKQCGQPYPVYQAYPYWQSPNWLGYNPNYFYQAQVQGNKQTAYTGI